MAPLCQKNERLKWCGVICGMSLHVLRVSGWRQAHFISSGHKVRQDSQYCNGDCAMQSVVHRHDVECAELHVSALKECLARIIDVHPMKIRESLLSSSFCAISCTAVHTPYSRACEMMTKRWDVVPTFCEVWQWSFSRKDSCHQAPSWPRSLALIWEVIPFHDSGRWQICQQRSQFCLLLRHFFHWYSMHSSVRLNYTTWIKTKRSLRPLRWFLTEKLSKQK